MQTFAKTGDPAELLGELAGLRDLAAAADAGGAPVVDVLSDPAAARAGKLVEPRLVSGAPTRAAAYKFGERLALTHAYSGDLAPGQIRVYGQAPSMLAGSSEAGTRAGTRAGVSEAGFGAEGGEQGETRAQARGAETGPELGRWHLRTVFASHPQRTFGEFYAADRIEPYFPAALANGSLSNSDVRAIEQLCEKLYRGDFDADEPALVQRGASLIHGDLWGGNILWATAESAREGAALPDETALQDGEQESVVGVLIDPVAHGGAAETDLASLTVFGTPYLEEIYAGYNNVSALSAGWRERVGLHRMHILMIHCAMFGGSYGSEAVAQARRYL
ncbi:fructosamine kinase family protein [Actinobaculum massiliense]|uniref:Fructosamine kinase n=1 Tax=Actinobaculum massiliense ACS-171-V-Col2 TaxID=883066 RepID=K9EY15_9ACTO|nr:fructosamine kinase family protein [Actinobaculum massiliense]EKU95847.1 hypothetical protein HMPREF9233_00634 [Actinobaculum massiliense ACS-171-V-Col2]MDK8318720.1 fructosamine kinase family protein [Actinobaculum massiliense]MDK8566444.1 fructosamine kinase family protein [Actinobaculum massiliense]